MANPLKKRLDKQYDSLRAQLKAGKITAAELKEKARIMHEHYKANKPKNGGRSTSPAPSPTPTRQTPTARRTSPSPSPTPTRTPSKPTRTDESKILRQQRSGRTDEANILDRQRARRALNGQTDESKMLERQRAEAALAARRKGKPKRPGSGSRYSGGVRNNNKPPSRTGPNRTQRRNRGR